MRRTGLGMLVGAALTAATMIAPVTANADATGLVAAYGFEEASGTGVVDSSGAGNAGTAAGAVRTTGGRFGKAMSFDGVDDRVNVNDAASLDLTTAMTLEAWVNPSAGSGSWRTVVIKEQPAHLAYVLYSAENTNRPSAHAFTNDEYDARGATSVPLNTWTHLAATYDGAILRLWVNGMPAGSRAMTGPMVTTSGALRIGGNAVWGEYFKGLIDEVRVYNRALTGTEIQADMAASVVPLDAPPSAPGGVAAELLDRDDVRVSWNAATDDVGIAGYRVHRATTAGFAPTDANLIATPTTLTHLDPDRPVGTSYYRVVAVDTAGNRSAPSNEVGATVLPDSTPPTPPTLAAPTVDVDDVRLEWTAATDDVGVTGYRVHRSTTADFTPSDANLRATKATLTHLDSNVPAGTYHYKVVAVDAAGNRSAPSNEVGATILPDTTPPTDGEPRGCGALSGDAQTEVWPRDDRGVASIELRLDGERIGLVQQPHWLFRWDTRRKANGPHTLTTVVRDAAGNEATWSCEVTIDNPPMTIEFTSPTDGASLDGTVTVAVTPRIGGNPTLGAGIRFKVDGVYVGPTDWYAPYQFTWNTTTVSEGPHELTADMWYLYDDPTPYVSESISVIVDRNDTTPPTAPGNLAANLSGDDVALSWSASTDNVGVSRYAVHRSATAGFTPSEDNRLATPSATSYADADLAPGTYHYKVVAEDADGNVSAPSAEVNVTIVEPAPAPSGLVASYGFDEASGGSAVDGSGNGNTGTISGATRTTSGKNAGALSFDGTNDLVTVPDAAALDLTGGMTLEAWVNPNRISGSWRTVLLKEQPGGMSYALYAAGSGGLPGGYIVSGGDEFSALGPSTLPLNAWTHLAATYDGSTLRTYVNGTQVAVEPHSGAMAPSTGALKIGGNNVWPEWFRGLIDDVRVYDRALTAAEIQADRDRPVGL
jgi:fibronectin type 3 domain-containing protein